MSNGLKLFLIAAGTLVTCIVVTITIHMANASRQIEDKFGQRINEMNADLETSDITMYDGVEIYGSDVVNFMKKQLEGYAEDETADFKVIVVTSNSPVVSYSYNNRKYLDKIQNFTDGRYIHPLHKFIGSVKFNANEVITSVEFNVK